MYNTDTCVTGRKMRTKGRYYNSYSSIQTRPVLNMNLKLSVTDRQNYKNLIHPRHRNIASFMIVFPNYAICIIFIQTLKMGFYSSLILLKVCMNYSCNVKS